MLIAGFGLALLVASTWALGKISAWIVFHDPVWAQMDKEGARLEHEIAETFLVGRDFHLPAVEVVLGAVFLIFLWKLLFRQNTPGPGIQQEVEGELPDGKP